MELLKSLPPNCNRSLKCQAVKKLFNQVCSKEANKTGQDKRSSELSTLWECAFAEDEVLSCISFEAILNLVKLEKLSATDVVQNIIDRFCKSKSRTRSLHALKRAFAFMSGKKFNVDTSNLSSSHPFNVLLSSDFDAASLFVPVIEDMFKVYGGQRDGFFKLMDPFFRFVFVQTKEPHRLRDLRRTIVQRLVQWGEEEEEEEEEGLDYLLNILPWMQHNDNETSAELVEYLQVVASNFDSSPGILRTMLRLVPEFQPSIRESIAELILGLICDPESKLVHGDLVLYNSLMNLTEMADLSKDFEILFVILEKMAFKTNRHFLAMFVTPLLQLVINSDPKAAYLYNLVSERLQPESEVNDEDFLPSQITPLNAIASLCKRVLSHDRRRRSWLSDVSVLLDLKGSSQSPPPMELFHLVCGLLHSTRCTEDAELILGCLERMCAANPHLSIELFPLLMSKLKSTTDPHQCLAILRSLPAISTNKVSTSMTLNFINSSGGLAGTSTGLLASLWRRHEDCFKQLIGRLQDCDSPPDERALTQATCLREICKSRAAKHGKECTAMVFSLLEGKTQRSVRILCMEAIFHLCLEKVLSFQSFWSYFQANLSCFLLSKSVTPSEARSLLGVFHVLPSLQLNIMTGEVLSYLWGLLTRGLNECALDEVFVALSKFPKSSFLLSQLPEEVTLAQRQKMEEKEVDESLREVIYGNTYLEFLERYHSTGIENGLGLFFERIVGDELSGLPRGIFFKFQEMIKLSFVYQLHMDANHKREVELRVSKLSTSCLHLTPNSLLRSCFEYIINFIKQGMPKEKLPAYKVILRSLTKNHQRHLLPPFNWTFILRPVLLPATDVEDEEALELSYRLLFQQAALHAPLGHSVLHLINGEEFKESKLDGRRIVMRNLCDVWTACPATEIKKSTFEDFVFPSLGLLAAEGGSEDAGLEHLRSFATNLQEFASSSLALKESKNYVWEVLESAIDLIPMRFHRELNAVMEVLPQVVVDRLLRSEEAEGGAGRRGGGGGRSEAATKVLMLRGHLVSVDRRSMPFINHSIEAFCRIDSSSDVDRCFNLVVLLQVFVRCQQRTQSSLRQWVTEFMSFVKFSSSRRKDHQTTVWMLAVWCSSMVAWSNCGLEGLLFFPTELDHVVIEEFSRTTDYDDFLLCLFSLLPTSLCRLLSIPEWTKVTENVLDFLLHLLTLKSIRSKSIVWESVKESLRSLRNLKSCQGSLSFWLRVAELLDFREGQKTFSL